MIWTHKNVLFYTIFILGFAKIFAKRISTLLNQVLFIEIWQCFVILCLLILDPIEIQSYTATRDSSSPSFVQENQNMSASQIISADASGLLHNYRDSIASMVSYTTQTLRTKCVILLSFDCIYLFDAELVCRIRDSHFDTKYLRPQKL